MKITAVEAIPVTIPFNTKFGIATGSAYGTGYVVVKIHTDEGLTGIGETGRFFEGEHQAGIVYTILNFFQPVLQQTADPLNIAQIHKELRVAIKDNRFTKSAVDIALHDLKGKASGLPVHSLLGGCYRERVELCQTIGIKDPKSGQQDANTYLAQGFKSFKVKIGLDPEGDLELVKAIRQTVGPDIRIRVDANAGYSAAVAIPILRAMEEYDLTLIEQPAPLWDLEGMRRVCEALDTPILACESARTPEDVMAIALHQAADMINIKIGRTSGFVGAKRMEAVADAAGLPVTGGTMMEMGIGTAAGVHMAATFKNLVDTCDFTGPTLLTDDILARPLRFEDGYLYLPEGPGLGVEIDEDKLRHYTVEI
jgi:muconate/chloromuconate cycloisomerase